MYIELLYSNWQISPASYFSSRVVDLIDSIGLIDKRWTQIGVARDRKLPDALISHNTRSRCMPNTECCVQGNRKLKTIKPMQNNNQALFP